MTCTSHKSGPIGWTNSKKKCVGELTTKLCFIPIGFLVYAEVKIMPHVIKEEEVLTEKYVDGWEWFWVANRNCEHAFSSTIVAIRISGANEEFRLLHRRRPPLTLLYTSYLKLAGSSILVICLKFREKGTYIITKIVPKTYRNVSYSRSHSKALLRRPYRVATVFTVGMQVHFSAYHVWNRATKVPLRLFSS